MKYECESRTWSLAAQAIRQRIRALPEFGEARASVVAAAIADCRGKDVAGLRELGGFTAVVERHIAALPERFRVDHGSKLLPSTVASELGSEVGAMRAEVQFACAEAWRTAIIAGTRVRIRPLGDEWAVAARSAFPGQAGEVTDVESFHWNGKENVPLATTVYVVKFDAEVMLHGFPRTAWRFNREELEVL